MTWQEFLNQQANIQGLSVEGKTTLLTALPQPDAQINQKQLSLELQITGATVKRRLQNIYQKFEKACPELSQKNGAGKFETLRTYLKQQYHQPQSNDIISSEFQSLIDEKIKSFCGRKFVFDAFENFINTNKKGYFTVIGDAGMGKSTIAAKYVFEHKTICYFNNLQENRNSPELFRESICKQLINRYQLTNIENDNLSTLLIKSIEKLTTNGKLIIVVDALDEVKQEPGGENILYLPKILPDNVYFFLTRRRYEPSKKRLYTEGVKQEELDLTDKQYDQENANDIQEYIRFCLEHDPEHKNGLEKWRKTKNITSEAFVNELATKSENNFMYLRYVLPAIAEDKYNDLNLTQLPQGLQNYYQTHWDRMKMNDSSKKMKVMILFILVEIGTPISGEMMFDIVNEDECDVQNILNEWIEYLKPQTIDEDICYSIYHASFLDFLKAKREFQPTRRLFDDVNQRIVDYWERIQG
ncbi:P-loop domain-containing protein [Cuspidothrix issatschenkoi]|uniref:transcriptional regulator n=1 Tax=Cuspidothrix issatschenkoi TaxID=230752 RepID=UPI001D13B480|nr:transcriptional regulator [Cuspidothrix issatschenkoi]